MPRVGMTSGLRRALPASAVANERASSAKGVRIDHQDDAVACDASRAVSTPASPMRVTQPPLLLAVLAVLPAIGCTSTSADAGSGGEPGDLPVDIKPAVFVTLSTGVQLGGYAEVRVDCASPTGSPRSVMVVVDAPYVQNASGRWDNGDFTNQWMAAAEVGALDATGSMTVPVSTSPAPRVPYAGVRFGDPTTPAYASSGTFSFTLGAGRTFSGHATVKPDAMSGAVKGTYALECRVPASALGHTSNGRSANGEEQSVVDKAFQTTCCAPFAALAQ